MALAEKKAIREFEESKETQKRIAEIQALVPGVVVEVDYDGLRQIKEEWPYHPVKKDEPVRSALVNVLRTVGTGNTSIWWNCIKNPIADFLKDPDQKEAFLSTVKKIVLHFEHEPAKDQAAPVQTVLDYPKYRLEGETLHVDM